MIHTLSFESKRIFRKRENIVIFLFFLFFSLYFVNVGIDKYKGFFLEKENFLNYEKKKIQRYINYEQYGAYGFRVLFEPSPLIVFFSSAFLSLEGAIDTKEIVNVSIDYKGKSIFTNHGAFGDFSSLFYTFGSLTMLFFGLGTFYGFGFSRYNGRKRGSRERNKIKPVLQVILSRFLCLNGYFSGVILTAFLTAKLQGIHLSGTETGIFILFCIYMLLFINLFYFFGILWAVILSFKRPLFITAYALWFMFCFFIPEINRIALEQKAKGITSNGSIDTGKLNNLMKFEKRYRSVIDTLKEEKVKNLKGVFHRFVDEYMKNEYRLNKDMENNLSKEVNRLIDYNEKKSIILPSTCYLFLAGELSSYSYSGYRVFLNYMLNLKDDFSRYFFDRRYSKIGQPVKPFIKGDENIFKRTCTLPGIFWPGLGIIFCTCLLLFGGGLYVFNIGAAPPPSEGAGIKERNFDIHRMEKGKTYFSLCSDNRERNGTLRYLDSRGVSIIGKLNLNTFDPGISLKSWIDFECKQRGISAARVLTGLEKAGVSTGKLKLRFKNLSSEILNKAYLEIKLSEQAPVYAFDNFLKDVSKQFERDFKKRTAEMEKRTIFLYIGSEMFDVSRENKEKSGEDSRFFIVDFDNISLR